MRSFIKHFVKNRIILLYSIAILLFIFSAFFGLLAGSTSINISDAILHPLKNSASSRIFWYVRFPRVLASILSGIALSLSGAILQAVLNNRLASPSIVGVNSGAGLAVTIAATFGIIGGFKLSVIAFLGAFFAVMLVSIGARKWGASRGTVILMGVALNSLFSAISDTVITFSPSLAIQSFDFKIGDFSAVTYSKIIPSAFIILISGGIALTLINDLDILALGDQHSKSLGMNPNRVRLLFLTLSALMSASAVSMAGLISFVGLLVPHTVKRLTTKSQHLLPLSALFGAGFLTLSDTLSRTLFAPYELPVGIIMAFMGAPFFIFILIKGGKNNA